MFSTLVLVLKTVASDALKRQFIKYRFRFKWFGQTDLDNSRHDQTVFNTKWAHHDFLAHMAVWSVLEFAHYVYTDCVM